LRLAPLESKLLLRQFGGFFDGEFASRGPERCRDTCRRSTAST
jgi:hypothetical protein